MEPKPDLDHPEAIHHLVQTFYGRLLNDPVMAPVFTEVAGVDLDAHLPTIEAYWRKMLLGEKDAYQRNMVAQHEKVHDRMPLQAVHADHWYRHFTATLDSEFEGPYADRAEYLATRILANLMKWLHERDRNRNDVAAETAETADERGNN
ncbi:group III truncated hemoglobin [Tamilnaduibacter salinus]|uniref:group III truncated hemoglobin n=1 Tax=Tamilnaduibacter salinus TaxID=1484056 RepID=UPI00117D8C49|nr:group III truncated hemoglobin [Tamilnaduibacter salinus]